jgi:hypothetical protein
VLTGVSVLEQLKKQRRLANKKAKIFIVSSREFTQQHPKLTARIIEDSKFVRGEGKANR